MNNSSTICAISTPPGTGGIAVIRTSGEKAVSIAARVFTAFKPDTGLLDLKGGKFLVGTIGDGTQIIDEVVVSLFKAPNSYTGEDVVEISCHGSIYIQQRILHLLLEKGATMAKPGEFTQRAFLNGKMDLSQAEAVADLIASSSEASHRIALQQMRGGFSEEIRKLRQELVTFTSLIELELDFSEEDVEFADKEALKELAVRIDGLISRLLESFRLGNAIKNGIPVAIIGETNVGKSTLLNALVKEEKAIVSEIHGTTRDIIEDVVNIKGVSFRIFDTAGLREAADIIESMGIERTYTKIEQAVAVLLMKDCTRPADLIVKSLNKIRKRIKGDQLVIILLNKSDLSTNEQILKITDSISLQNNEIILPISARKNQNLEKLTDILYEKTCAGTSGEADVIVTNLRHYEALSHAREAILRVKNGLDELISGDFIAQDIRECLHYLGEITGEITTDEVLGNIFKNFCIGK